MTLKMIYPKILIIHVWRRYCSYIFHWNMSSYSSVTEHCSWKIWPLNTHGSDPNLVTSSGIQGCESACEKKSEIIWNAWKDVLFNALKVWKWGFVKSKKVWNQIKILTLTSLLHQSFMHNTSELLKKLAEMFLQKWILSAVSCCHKRGMSMTWLSYRHSTHFAI